MKTENEMNNNGQRTPAAGNGTRKPNFRHKNYRYKAQPKKDGKMVRNKDRISRPREIINLSSAVRVSLP